MPTLPNVAANGVEHRLCQTWMRPDVRSESLQTNEVCQGPALAWNWASCWLNSLWRRSISGSP